MHVERLERMRDLLRKDAANPRGVQFDLGTWAEPAVPGHQYEFPIDEISDDKYYSNIEAIKVDVSCGTKACAFGLAAISGEFAEEGLTYAFMAPYRAQEQPGPMLKGSLMPTLGFHRGMNAASVLFDITLDDAQYFFDPESYDGTPREAEGELEVARRIDDFINGHIDYDYHPSYREGEAEEEND